MPRDPELLGRALPLVEQALAADEEDRTALVRRLCAQDRELEAVVRELLARDATGQGFLEDPPSEIRAAGLAPETTTGGTQLGPYRLIRRIGEGGMGVVFLARRVDQFEQQVAIKLIRRELATPLAIDELRGERQILADLEHPSIARLLDGGADPQGLPYLVMEWVQGVPIDEYCDRQRLSVEERVRLMLEVCSAVQYAHQRLVVHRDLKPGNILVTEKGRPKLLDFGIARLLSVTRDGDTTVTGERRFTPNFASPEQIAGKAVSTASDVYSLGVVLYTLLCGQLPRRLSGASAGETSREGREGTPSAPSAAAGRHQAVPVAGGEVGPDEAPAAVAEARRSRPKSLRRTLRGDLDAICLQALQTEVGERYGSVDALSHDLGAYLAGLPVTARRSGRLVRFGKHLHRNWPAVAAAVALVALTALAALQGRRASRERDLAVSEQRHARDVTAFLVHSFALADPSSGEPKDLTVRQLVDRAAEKLDQDLSRSPESTATLRETLGEVYGELGDYEKGIALLEESLRQRRQLFGPRHPVVATSLDALATLTHRAGDDPRAERLAKEATELRRSLGVPDEALAHSLDTLGLVETARGDLTAAEKAHSEAFELSRRPTFDDEDLRISITEDLAATLSQLGRKQEASDLLAEALAMSRRKYGPDHPTLARTLNNYGVLLDAQWRYEEAVGIYRQVLAIARKQYGDKHIATIAATNNLAMTLRGVQQPQEAERLLRTALQVLEEQVGSEHPAALTVACNLGLTLQDRGNLTEAERIQRRVLAARRRVLGPDHPYLLKSLAALGWVLRDEGKLEQARQVLAEGVELGRRIVDPSQADRVEVEVDQGIVLGELGAKPEALAMLSQAQAARERTFGADHPRVAQILVRRSAILLDSGEFEQAGHLASHALDILAASRSTQRREALVARSVLGASLVLSGELENGRALLERSHSELAARCGADSWEVEQASRRAGLAAAGGPVAASSRRPG